MAKKREKPPVNPLSTDLIAAAVAPVPALPAVPPAEPAEKQQQYDAGKGREGALRREPSMLRRRVRDQKTLRVRFPDTEFEENEAFTKTLRGLMGGSKVTESDITRALWSLARRAEDAMRELRSKAPKTARPANGDWVAKAEYDDAVAHFLHLAIKRLGVQD